MASRMNNEERLQLFRSMAESDPENELAHFSIGKLSAEAGSWPEAELALRRCLEINENHSVALSILGESLLAQDKRDEAVELLGKGIVVAHERGEFMPRDKMRELLKSIGVTPPDLTSSADDDAAPVDPDAWVCRRCFKANPPLEEAPFSNDLGQKVLDGICKSCWSEWIAMSIKVINEFRLNMATPESNQIYDDQLREFLGL